MPPGSRSAHGGAKANIDALLDQIDGLGPRQREQLYLRLLYGSPVPAASPGPNSATTLANPATEMTNPVTVLRDPASDVLVPVADSSAASESEVLPSGGQTRQGARGPICLRIFDLDGRYSAAKGSLLGRLEKHLQQVDDWAGASGSFERDRIAFKVTYESAELSKAKKRLLGPRVFPVYIIDDSKAGIAEVHRLMDEHGYPATVPTTTKRSKDRAATDWGRHVIGVTMPAHIIQRNSELKKITFIKGARLLDASKDSLRRPDMTYLGNLIVHETGHACGIFGQVPGRPSPHPKDGSVMQVDLPERTMKERLLAYNPGHAATVFGMLTRLSRLAILLLMFAAGCSRASQPAPCIPNPEQRLKCGPCSEPSNLDTTARRAITARLASAVIRADQESTVFYDNGAGQSFYRMDGFDEVLSNVPRAARVDDLDEIAKMHPRVPVRFVEIRPVGVSGSDAAYFAVDVTLRVWLPDSEAFRDEGATAAYCVRRHDGKLEITATGLPLVFG